MDLMMPEMDGVATTRAIRERFPTIQVIALTSFPEEQMLQDVLEAGALSYLLKNVGRGRAGAGDSRGAPGSGDARA